MPTVGVFAAIVDDRRRILLVKRNYGPRDWTPPGGALESRESPLDGVSREVLEETGHGVDVHRLIGVYSAPFKDDLVLLFAARITGRREDDANREEIAEVAFLERADLPPLTPRTLQRVVDAYDGAPCVVRVFAGDSMPES